MSRRLRDLAVLPDLSTLIETLQSPMPEGAGLLRLDAKPPPITSSSADTDATEGDGARGADHALARRHATSRRGRAIDATRSRSHPL